MQSAKFILVTLQKKLPRNINKQERETERSREKNKTEKKRNFKKIWQNIVFNIYQDEFLFILLCVLCVFRMKKENLVKSNIGSFQRQVLLRMVGIKLKLLVLLACVTLKNIIQLCWVKRICSIPKKTVFPSSLKKINKTLVKWELDITGSF